MKTIGKLFALMLALLSLFSCIKKEDAKLTDNKYEDFQLQSNAFINGEQIPIKHCQGYDDGKENISPSFKWVNPPANVKSFALIIHDSSSNKKWIHWAVFNIPADCNEIQENASGSNMPVGSIELNNQFRTFGYGGPEPPKGGGEHTYIATLYALNTSSIKDINGFKSLSELNSILKGKVIAKTEASGVYINHYVPLTPNL